MQHHGLHLAQKLARTFLSIVGVILLIIFGTRAASQASSLQAVGGQVKRAFTPNIAAVAASAAIPGSTNRYLSDAAVMSLPASTQSAVSKPAPTPIADPTQVTSDGASPTLPASVPAAEVTTNDSSNTATTGPETLPDPASHHAVQGRQDQN